MMRFTPVEEFMMVLRGDDIKSFPRVIPFNPPFLDIMKRVKIYWPEAHRDGKLMAGLASATNRLLGFNSVNVPFDMTVEAEALGCDTVWKDEHSATPQVRDSGIKNPDVLNFGDDILTRGRFPVVFEAVQRLVEENEGRIPVLPFIEGPFTVGCLVVGISTMFKCMIKDEEKARWVLDRCTALSILYAKRLLELKATSIIILDPNVMGLTLKQFQKMILPCYKRISEEIGALFVLHICGDVSKILDILPESGFCAFSFDYPQVDVEMVKKCIGDRMKIIGSVPTVTHLLNGTREDVFKISIEMIEKGTDILAPSCFIAPQTPFENAKAIADAIGYWNGSQTH